MSGGPIREKLALFHIVETGEGWAPSQRNVLQLVKERGALAVGFLNNEQKDE